MEQIRVVEAYHVHQSRVQGIATRQQYYVSRCLQIAVVEHLHGTRVVVGRKVGGLGGKTLRESSRGRQTALSHGSRHNAALT
jgi:hypothetical protein